MQMKNGGEAIQKKVDQVTNEVFILNASAEYRIKVTFVLFYAVKRAKTSTLVKPLKVGSEGKVEE